MLALLGQLTELGLSREDALHITNKIKEAITEKSKKDCWQYVAHHFLQGSTPKYPFALHELLYKSIFPDWEKMPAPAWVPNKNSMEATHIGKFLHEKQWTNYSELHRWSVEHYPNYWLTMLKLLNIIFDKPYAAAVDLCKGTEKPRWFPEASLNIVNSCFQHDENAIAILHQTEKGFLTEIRYGELNKLSNRIANSLVQYLEKGDRVAIIMPMTREAVAIYLGIIKAGCVVVSIADSFAADEIATRLRISKVKAIFCQDFIFRDEKILPLYERIKEATELSKSTTSNSFSIILNADPDSKIKLQNPDLNWTDFLSENEVFKAVSCSPEDYINILFSSGTTGEPKAIPWTHTTPIKCASDAYWHHDIQPQDRMCWPSNLGWMMGPWLIFACLLNKATIALYEGSPNGKKFGQFIQNNKINLLGVVPTFVKTWRNSGCMEGLDWSLIKLFTSTGESSNIEDMLYLMYLANYRPIIEYCGGTEIGGAYITSTVLHPSAPAACTTPALGLDFVILNENDSLSNSGEVALIPPSIGLSTALLNKDHHHVYYEGMPKGEDGNLLRRHGDHIVRYSNGYYRLQGRTDDTMKLGGIKVSSAEIERILNALPAVYETAAIAVEPKNGGPSQLIIYAVLKPEEIMNTDALKNALKTNMQNAIKQHLNPLFKIHELKFIPTLPRTASNKVMRRVLRERYLSS